jgi:hypothetical protein
MMTKFQAAEYLPDALMARVTETRVNDPEYALRRARARVRREKLAPSGKLNILAADHPARRVTKVGDNALGMADRRDYLARILRVLEASTVDGLMATMDLIEEILILDGLLREKGAASPVDGKLLIASLNRGGLAGVAWELDDAITGPGPGACAEWKLDGAKILMRVGDGDPGSLKTILASAEAITACNAMRIPMFLEPLVVTKGDSGWTVSKDAAALAKLVGVASALGDSSRYLWLKLPYAKGFESVARATTLPILLLGGEAAGDPAPFLQEMRIAMQSGHNVRGALVGRNVLYPGDGDPLRMAEAVGGIVHKGWGVEEAMSALKAGAKN